MAHRSGLKVSIFCRRGAAHHFALADAMSDGLAKHKINLAIFYDDELPTFIPDVAIIWGWKRKGIINQVRSAGGNVLIAEAGYFNNPTRLDFISLGWNGLNGRADFRNQNMKPTRWAKVGMMPKPWKQSGERIVIIGQVPGDQSIQGVDMVAWYINTFDRLSEQQSLPVVFRPHPKAIGKAPPLPLCLCDTLSECLDHADQVVTFNSNTAVDAVLAGVPATAMDRGSMAYAVASHQVGQRIMPDRHSWMYNLAHTQWTIAEIRAGEAWHHIKL